MRIILTGPKGSGKSTIGRELAAIAKLKLIETDELAESVFEHKHGHVATCRQICLEYGEPFFREIEHAAVFEALREDQCVICTGGQTVRLADCRAALVAAGQVVVLRAPFELIWERIERQGYPPYFPDRDQKEWFRERAEAVYQVIDPHADLIVDVSRMSAREAAARIHLHLSTGPRR